MKWCKYQQYLRLCIAMTGEDKVKKEMEKEEMNTERKGSDLEKSNDGQREK